jgi:hypothetical protein
VIVQLADPAIIQWIMETARKAAAEAGRDPAARPAAKHEPHASSKNSIGT